MFEKIYKLAKDRLRGYLNYFLFIISVLLALSLARNILRTQQTKEKIKEVEERVEKLRRENKELQEKVTEVKSKEFVEKQLRDKLSLAKEGEIIVVLPEDEILRKLAPKVEEEEETLPDPNWKKWLKLFY